MSEKQSPPESFSYNIFVFFLACMFFSWLFAAVSFAYELLHWLKTKEWLTFLDMLTKIDSHEWITLSPWIQHPDSWYGLHTVTMGILQSPLSIVLFVFGFLMLLMCFPFSG